MHIYLLLLNITIKSIGAFIEKRKIFFSTIVQLAFPTGAITFLTPTCGSTLVQLVFNL